MASASAGLELPATSLIAPLLGRIAVSWREAPLPRALITRRRQGWQYDGQPGSSFVPRIHWGVTAVPHRPLPRLRGRDREGAREKIERAGVPPPPPPPPHGGGGGPGVVCPPPRGRGGWRA